MDSDELKALITKRLNDFYQQRAQWLDRVRLRDVLGRENPHLIRAIGTYCAFDIVVTALAAYLDSLDGGIFSDTFFEPIAQALFSKVISLDASAELPIQLLWKKLTGVPGFYPTLIRLMETKTVSFKSYPAYQDAWARAANSELRPKNWTQKRRFLVNSRPSGLLGQPLALELDRGQVA